MEINGKSVTGKGQGVYNTVGASAGIAALLGMGGNGGCGCGNGGILGGILGGNKECYVNEKELNLSIALANANAKADVEHGVNTSLQALYAQTIRADDQIKAVNASIADGLIQTGNALGILSADVKCLQKEVDRNREESFRNMREAKEYTDTRVNCEAQLRKADDEKIIIDMDGKFRLLEETKVDWSKRINSKLLCEDPCCNCN